MRAREILKDLTKPGDPVAEGGEGKLPIHLIKKRLRPGSESNWRLLDTVSANRSDRWPITVSRHLPSGRLLFPRLTPGLFPGLISEFFNSLHLRLSTQLVSLNSRVLRVHSPFQTHHFGSTAVSPPGPGVAADADVLEDFIRKFPTIWGHKCKMLAAEFG